MSMKWESNFMKQCKHKKKPPQRYIDNSIMKCSTYNYKINIHVIKVIVCIIPDIKQYGVGLFKVSSRDIELHINLLLSIANITTTAPKLIQKLYIHSK